MTAEFQRNVLRYLFQNKTMYLEYIKPDIFDDPFSRSMYELLYNYIIKYKHLPERSNFVEFIWSNNLLNPDAKLTLKNELVWLYEPLKDIAIIQETLLEEVKKQMFKNVLLEALKKQEEGISSEDIEYIHSKISKITSLDDTEGRDGLFFLKDINRVVNEDYTVYPSFLKGLNNMTSVGGFHMPQVITFMKPPKAFGTGFLIKFATEWVKKGHNVFYADFENGQNNIHNRFKQCLLECKIEEIKQFNTELNQIKNSMENLTGAGEAYIKEYQKRKDHFGHIELDIDRLIDQDFKPDIMIYDYINIMGCSDKKERDPRLKIQHNYADAYNINKKYGTFCLTVAKMKGDAWKKDWPGPDDIAEDKEIIYNSHAVFALMRNEEDIKDNLGRIIPIAQRQGISYTKIACDLEIDAEDFIIRELD